MKIHYSFLFLLFSVFSCTSPVDTSWPEMKPEAKPGVRWWWMGNAVDSAGLKANMQDMHDVGIGAVEITPVYGINGAEHRHIDYLSPRWMNMYKYVHSEGQRLGILIDMNNGTGWPFGGPTISTEDAASRVIFEKYPVSGNTRFRKKIVPDNPRVAGISTIDAVIACSGNQRIDLTGMVAADQTLTWDVPDGEWTIWAVFNSKTMQKVKRASPGGEGWVMNHYSRKVVDHYLSRFDKVFSAAGAPWPNSFFNDSYEVYGADWSDNLLDEFEKRRGYKLQDYIPELNREGDPETCARIVCDYRQTLAEMMMAEFTIPWTQWAHSHGATIRNQAHGSPGNLIDFYAAVDIPECESFGRTIFDIPGLKYDKEFKESDAHPSTMKYASSAANITGKTLVSSETFTWLTEHFRTSLSQMKPELDQMFASGVNHMYYHGSPYSPKDVPWPGWLFYASVNMNANNTIFRDSKGFHDYVARAQSFLQYGQPDNDFLVYLPIFDIWQEQQGLYLLFDIHKMDRLMPAFLKMVVNIQQLGFDSDYISDKYLLETTVNDGFLKTPGAKYKAIIVPNVQYIPAESMEHLVKLANEGATIIFTDRIPGDVPGFSNLEARRTQLEKALSGIAIGQPFTTSASKSLGKGKVIYGTDYSELLRSTSAKEEEMSVKHGAKILRRKHDQGNHYFITMLQNRPLKDWVRLSVPARSAVIYNPLDGTSGKAMVRKKDGQAEVYLELEPGQSLILKTFHSGKADIPVYPFYKKGTAKELTGDWNFRFTDGMPAIDGEFTMKGSPVSWTELSHDNADIYAGMGRYSLTFDLKEKENADEWLLNLGNLCESARIHINGQDAGIVWSIPYTAKIGQYLKEGANRLDVDVTNLPANLIRDYDQRGVNWRIFKDINIVSVFYKNIRYDDWDVSPSGLTSPVTLTPLTQIN